MRLKEVMEVKYAISEELLFKPSSLIKTATVIEGLAEIGKETQISEVVNGVGIGFKKDSYFIKILLEKEISFNKNLLSDYFGIFPDDIHLETIGKIHFFHYPLNPTNKYRPAFPGVSIGHFKITAGTFGCLVADDIGVYILSNNHVLADSNKAEIGDVILQPGPYDGGKVGRDEIAVLSAYNLIDFMGTNRVDVAIAEPLDYSMVTPEILFIGRIQGIDTPRIGMNVMKFGRSSGFTTGKITTRSVDIKVVINNKRVIFEDQIEIRSQRNPFSKPGDSGSIIVNAEQKAIGLLFAGNNQGITFANPISDVLTTLGVKLL